MKTRHYLIIFLMAIIITSCNKFENPNPNPGEGNMNDLKVPASFDFKTTKDIILNISDSEEVSYDIYSITQNSEPTISYIDNDTLVNIDKTNQLLASGFTKNGSLSIKLTVPGHQEFLYLKRKKAGSFKAEYLNINNQTTINYQHTNFKSLKTTTKELIYAVNGNGQAFYIDIETGETNFLANFDKGAYACAVDKANNALYIAERKSPYKLRKIDLSTKDQTVIGNLQKNFDRMDFDPHGGILYIGRGKWVYAYDPTSASYITQYKLEGPKANLSGGDLAYAGNNTFYFTSVSEKVLYKGVIHGNKIKTELITSNLSNKTTSSDLGSDGYLYYATNSNPSKVYKVNVTTGADEYLYSSVSATNQKFKANDFGILEKDTAPPANDKDGDGVPDQDDKFPDDPNKAYKIWTPGENQYGTLAFEDLWPGLGDYDFNDMVIYYRFLQITNADNEVVELKGFFLNRHEGANLVNGFGVELPIPPSDVQSVAGNSITDNYITTSANGTEAEQDNAVIIVYDNGDKNLGIEREVTIKLNNPIEQIILGDAPFNPFLIKNQERTFEVHLPDKAPTSLADKGILGTGHDNSIPAQNRYYKTQKHLPWAINIPVEFVWPKEKMEIIKGYLKFKEWAESGGSSYPDWYIEKDGYREPANLDVQ